ncbi:helix-turn-helix transcriptional regulator [Vibrio parahaemolyticus]|nr:helix-turn-helix transcriptional regulator [Vibrio parahaemolyticus]HAV1412765.1 helix-turn-helix transcriptional regulator [Vibrio parahaemolyticus]HAV2004849.1 helix-turn-helix transcriptional regulator [Vibrio parahaemolyticus]
MENLQELDTIGKRLRWARKQRKLSQHDLGVPQSLVSKLERGQMTSTKHIFELADACKVSVFWLQTGLGHPNAVQRLSRFEELDHAVEKFGLTDDEIDKVLKSALHEAMQIFLSKK